MENQITKTYEEQPKGIPRMNSLTADDVKEQRKAKSPSPVDDRELLKKHRIKTIPVPTREQVEEMKSTELQKILIKRRDEALRAVARKVDSLTNRYKTIETKIEKVRSGLTQRQTSDGANLEELGRMMEIIQQHKNDMAAVVLQLQIEDRLLELEQKLEKEVNLDE